MSNRSTEGITTCKKCGTILISKKPTEEKGNWLWLIFGIALIGYVVFNDNSTGSSGDVKCCCEYQQFPVSIPFSKIMTKDECLELIGSISRAENFPLRSNYNRQI